MGELPSIAAEHLSRSVDLYLDFVRALYSTPENQEIDTPQEAAEHAELLEKVADGSIVVPDSTIETYCRSISLDL